MTPRERLLADIRRLADELPCVGLAACSKASAVRTGDERLALLLELARTDLLPDGVGWLERLQDA